MDRTDTPTPRAETPAPDLRAAALTTADLDALRPMKCSPGCQSNAGDPEFNDCTCGAVRHNESIKRLRDAAHAAPVAQSGDVREAAQAFIEAHDRNATHSGATITYRKGTDDEALDRTEMKAVAVLRTALAAPAPAPAACNCVGPKMGHADMHKLGCPLKRKAPSSFPVDTKSGRL